MSMNDHGWGPRPDPGGNNRGNQGPPDLEELWRDVNRRLSSFFGKKNGGPGGGMQQSPLSPRQFGGGIVMLLVLVLALWLASGVYIVDEGQRGLVLRFGSFNRITGPGPNLRLPWPIETHEIVDLSRVRTIEVGYRGTAKVLKEALMLTDDENIVMVQFAVQYRLKDPQNFIFKNRHPDETVMGAAETAIREVVGKNKMDFVLYEGREQIASNTSKLIQEILDRYETGVLVTAVTLQSTQPPEQVQAAFDDAVKAGQDRERQKNEGQAYANDVVPRARGTASRLLQEAEGYRQSVIANAEGEASRFKQILVEYNKAPEVTRNRMYLETVQQVLSSTSKVLVDARNGSNLLYLPLDKLMQAAGAPASPVASGTANAAGHETPAHPATVVSGDVPPQLEKPDGSLSRSRDTARLRERGER
ncbi:MAG: FtsH protease activity modulator HflK [Sterolibacterium sp.]|nr:FtsH protease activity modulator HflK [Sterolibacterium sp.]MBP9799579.1 FtsH protease activity modulator HflK [Sterolibacterium sp.]